MEKTAGNFWFHTKVGIVSLKFFAFINKRSIVEGNISQLSCTCCSIKEAVFTLIGKIAFIATHFFYLYKCVHVHPARLHFKCVEKKKVWKYVCTLRDPRNSCLLETFIVY